MNFPRERVIDQSAASADDAGWLITLCDLSLLLLCFFIVLHVADKRRAANLVPPPIAAPVESPPVAAAPADEPPPLTIAFALKQAELSADMLPILDQPGRSPKRGPSCASRSSATPTTGRSRPPPFRPTGSCRRPAPRARRAT